MTLALRSEEESGRAVDPVGGPRRRVALSSRSAGAVGSERFGGTP